MVTVKDALLFLKHRISSDFETREILCFILSIEKTTLLSEPERLLQKDEVRRIKKAALLRKKNVPLQYILGYWEFYGRRFFVDRRVLIPRSDTETLIDAVKAKSGPSPRFLDLCAGSGIIGLTLEKELSGSGVMVEKDKKALSLLRENSALHNSRLEIVRADVLKNCHFGNFDIIVSNPPYVTKGEYKTLDKQVKKEPKKALVAPENGLLFYRKIVENFSNCLNPDGFFAFEIGAGQKKAVEKILSDFAEISTIKDLSGNDRVVIASRG